MTYRFRKSETSALAAVRRVAWEEIDSALTELEDRTMPLDQKTHQLRKRAKRLRGLFRLMRPGFPDYAEHNMVIRDAARSLATLREHGALQETITKLETAPPTGSDTSDLSFAKSTLVSATKSPVDTNTALLGYVDALQFLSSAIPTWTFEGGPDALHKGIGMTFAQGKTAMKRCGKHPKIEDIHLWRKRVKDHWYHARLLEKTFPKDMPKRAKLAGTLGELLGDYHDLSILRATVESSDAFSARKDHRKQLLKRIKRRQALLLKRARRLGRKLYDHKRLPSAKKWRRVWAGAGPAA